MAGAASAEEVVIAAFGDSLTAGYGLPQDEGFVAQMEGWLEAQGAEVQMINAGLSGDTTAGGLSRVDWTLGPDVDAMILALGANDMLRGLDPGEMRSNLSGILEAAAAAEVPVLLVGIVSTPNFGPEYKAAFDTVFPELAEEFGVLYAGGWFDGLRGAANGDLARARSFFQADGIHPSAEGVALIVADMGPDVLTLIAAVE